MRSAAIGASHRTLAGSLLTEALGAGVIVLPVLTSLFTDGLLFAAMGIAVALAGMLWGILTKMRRRIYGAAGVGLATAILTLVAAAASTAPESVAFWVTGAGIGFTVLMAAGYIEAYRKRRGQIVEQIDRLMERWA